MAIFPALTPSSRTFTPGRRPHSEIPTLNGLQTRVMTSNVILEQQLRLTFIGLTESEMLSIRTHYIGQQGRFLSFGIPSSLLSGMTTPSYFTPTGYSWIYGAAPQVEDIPGTQRYNVSVELITIPPEGANVNGAEFTVSITLAAGIASVPGDATGADLTVAASIEGGVVADNSSAGFELTVSVSLAAGAASGGTSAMPIYVDRTGPSSSTGGFQLAWPTHQSGDIGILIAETSGDDSTLTITSPSGWAHVTGSPVVDVASTAGSKLQVLWYRATSASEAGVNIPDPGDHLLAGLFTFRGCAASGNPWDVTATGTKTTASTTATAPGVTTTVANALILNIVGRPDDASAVTHFSSPTNANLTSLTEIREGGTTSGNGGGFVLVTGGKASAGATGDTTITKSASTTDTYVTIALKP
jgi:hypothetical protein